MSCRSFVQVQCGLCLAFVLGTLAANVRSHQLNLRHSNPEGPLDGFYPDQVLCSLGKDSKNFTIFFPWCVDWVKCINDKAQPEGTPEAVLKAWAPQSCQEICGLWPSQNKPTTAAPTMAVRSSSNDDSSADNSNSDASGSDDSQSKTSASTSAKPTSQKPAGKAKSISQAPQYIRASDQDTYIHAEGNTNEGQLVKMHECPKAGNHANCQWSLQPSSTRPGKYYIKASDQDTCIHAEGSTDVGHKLAMHPCPRDGDHPNCQWSLEPSSTRPGMYYIKASDQDTYIHSLGTTESGQQLEMHACPKDGDYPNCQWFLEGSQAEDQMRPHKADPTTTVPMPKSKPPTCPPWVTKAECERQAKMATGLLKTKPTNKTTAALGLLGLSERKTNACVTSCENFKKSFSTCVSTIIFEPGKLVNMGMPQKAGSLRRRVPEVCTRKDTHCMPDLAIRYQKCLHHRTHSVLNPDYVAPDQVGDTCPEVERDFAECRDCPQLNENYLTQYAAFTGGCLEQMHAYRKATEPGDFAIPHESGCSLSE